MHTHKASWGWRQGVRRVKNLLLHQGCRECKSQVREKGQLLEVPSAEVAQNEEEGGILKIHC